MLASRKGRRRRVIKHRILLVVAVLFSSCEPELQSTMGAVPAAPTSGGASISGSEGARVPSLELRLSPEQAYAKGNHRRTALDLGNSKLDADVRQYVEEMFACIDEGIALRMTTLDDFFAGRRDIESYSKAHKQLETFIRSRTPPTNLRGYHDKLLEAFGAQREFFVEWAKKGAPFARQNVFSHAAVSRCSHALLLPFNFRSQKPHGHLLGLQ